MNTAETKKRWPADAVMIVAAPAGQEVREQMESVVPATCRDCGGAVAADSHTIRVAEEAPVRCGRPVRFFCIPCAVTYDVNSITHFTDDRGPHA